MSDTTSPPRARHGASVPSPSVSTSVVGVGSGFRGTAGRVGDLNSNAESISPSAAAAAPGGLIGDGGLMGRSGSRVNPSCLCADTTLASIGTPPPRVTPSPLTPPTLVTGEKRTSSPKSSSASFTSLDPDSSAPAAAFLAAAASMIRLAAAALPGSWPGDGADDVDGAGDAGTKVARDCGEVLTGEAA